MIRLDTRLHAYRSDLADIALKGRVDALRFVQGLPLQVSAPHAPVRDAPDPRSVQVTEALCGETAAVFETTAAGWAWAQLQRDNYVGWVRAEALTENAPEPTHRVSALRTLVFSGPDIKTPPLCGLPFGAEIAVAGEAEDRNARYALLAAGGAVVRQHLVPLDATDDDWTGVAERFLGTPYLWGGKTSLGIDCSGLVQVALHACGFAAPRDTDMQEAELGGAVSMEAGLPQLRRGDLVFWKGHVGMMVDGEILLHANAHHMAVAAEPLRLVLDRQQRRSVPLTSIRRF